MIFQTAGQRDTFPLQHCYAGYNQTMVVLKVRSSPHGTGSGRRGGATRPEIPPELDYDLEGAYREGLEHLPERLAALRRMQGLINYSEYTMYECVEREILAARSRLVALAG